MLDLHGSKLQIACVKIKTPCYTHFQILGELGTSHNNLTTNSWIKHCILHTFTTLQEPSRLWKRKSHTLTIPLLQRIFF